MRLVVGEGMRVAVVGVTIGVAVALWASQFVKALRFNVEPCDPVVFGLVAATLIVVAGVASWAPAVRASRVDPNEALRSD